MKPIDKLIEFVKEMSSEQTDGEWLEAATQDASPLLRDWDIAVCYEWAVWPDRLLNFPESSETDIGIDLVGVRGSDSRPIAIQCKARQLDENGEGAAIGKSELDSFVSLSAQPFFAERWVVTNGSVPLGANAVAAFTTGDNPLKLVNLSYDLRLQKTESATEHEEECPHCEAQSSSAPPPRKSSPDAPKQTKSCMQQEAVRESVRILREHEQSDSGGLPKGQARGKIVLPCGTGKTRISLRIVEELTPDGGTSVVLCPSIALVAQIRREYRQHSKRALRVLGVCSDQTAGYDAKREDKRLVSDDPTSDASNVSASEVKGFVTTDAVEIADWISSVDRRDAVNVIFGTYQSGHRVAAALKRAGATVSVLIADEAHRTAGLPQSKAKDAAKKKVADDRLRTFALCHDQEAFPATFRVYQTATPRIYGPEKTRAADDKGWIVRSMDDEATFGVELYRKSYPEAVRNGWLADYRIIAIGVNDPDAYRRANRLAAEAIGSGKNPLTTSDMLRGLGFAMAMGGTTDAGGAATVDIKSCIAFMNTVAKSKRMSEVLVSESVRRWLREWLKKRSDGTRKVARYTLEHVDATSNVTKRDNAKHKLARAAAGETQAHGVINVGIFGEGTDSPTLSAVAFLESRKSPIDVIQAVGRAMRTAEGKQFGYIVVPVLIPPTADPEDWLKTSGEQDWQELGQILLALRAHDERIENELEKMLTICLPEPPKTVESYVAIGDAQLGIRYYEHIGKPGDAEMAVKEVVEGARPEDEGLEELPDGVLLLKEPEPGPHQIITGKPVGPVGPSGNTRPEDTTPIVPELRIDVVQRDKPKKGETQGVVNPDKSKKRAIEMLNGNEGRVVTEEDIARKRSNRHDQFAKQAFIELKWDENANAIKMNLLKQSGLTSDKVTRDLNLLRDSVNEAARLLKEDGLKPALDRHHELDNLKSTKDAADGPTIAALLMMNAAMLHQRIAHGRWMSEIDTLEAVQSSTNIVREVTRQWNRITRQDFVPVIQPALDAVYAIEDTGKLSGLELALRHIVAEAARIAETYADMGADHAGALFNKVMGNQSSDGAFFTRPVAASLLARLALDAAEDEDTDWTDPETWKRNRAVDLACGSGTLLAALLTDMKRRANKQGADQETLGRLHKLAVEDTLKGMDINPVSLQLAASRLTAGNQDIAFRRMGLHLMPYGPTGRADVPVAAGTLELLAQSEIVGRGGKMPIPDNKVASSNVWGDGSPDDPEMEDAVEAAKDARIVVMNPPFTNRAKMGEKFPISVKSELQGRVDDLRRGLFVADGAMDKFGDTNSIGHLFVALADSCTGSGDAVVAMVEPTVTLANPSGLGKRLVWSDRFHIHTVLTCHDPRELNLSENTNINESIIIAKRRIRKGEPTRFISLDRLPPTQEQVDDLFEALSECEDDGTIPGGWGQVSKWPADRVANGDWTPGIWRAPELAMASNDYATDREIVPLRETGLAAISTSATIRAAAGYRLTDVDVIGSFRGLRSSGEDGQKRIRAQADARWIRDGMNSESLEVPSDGRSLADPVMSKAGHLLITGGQDAKGARLTAVADDQRYVGTGWLPVTDATKQQAKALAVFINSTPGRIQLMRILGRKLAWPKYWPAGINSIRVPDPSDDRIMRILSDCWERTKGMLVPQFGEGECEVRRIWDDAVAEAMGWDADELTRLRLLLHKEPHVSGRRYGHYSG